MGEDDDDDDEEAASGCRRKRGVDVFGGNSLVKATLYLLSLGMIGTIRCKYDDSGLHTASAAHVFRSGRWASARMPFEREPQSRSFIMNKLLRTSIGIRPKPKSPAVPWPSGSSSSLLCCQHSALPPVRYG